MAIDVISRHKKQKGGDNVAVQGQHKSGHYQNSRLDDSLRGLKSKSRPRRRIGGFMMHQMKRFEQFGVVHGAVRPVKIGIVQQNKQEKRQHSVSRSVLIPIFVEHRMWPNDGVIKNHSNQRKHNKSQNRIENFALIVSRFLEFRLNFAGLFLIFFQT